MTGERKAALQQRLKGALLDLMEPFEFDAPRVEQTVIA